MRPALLSDMTVQFSSGNNGTADPLNQTWRLSVTMQDKEYRTHNYVVTGNDLIRLPSVEVLTAALLKLLLEGIKD